MQFAVNVRGWPAQEAALALLAVAADPGTRSPMRLAEAGPWWDGKPLESSQMPSEEEVVLAEAELAEAGGLRVLVQRRAREQLRAEGLPVRRATVAIRALELLRTEAAASSVAGMTPSGGDVGRHAVQLVVNPQPATGGVMPDANAS